jgi:hypothetical protein
MKPITKEIKQTHKVSMTLVVYLDVKADSQMEAQSILRHKVQNIAATNADLACYEQRKAPWEGTTEVPLP